MNPISRTKFATCWLGLMSLLLLLISGLSLYGCSRPNAPAGVAVQTATLSTSTQTPVATPTLSGPEFDSTKLAGIATFEAPYHERETRIAEGTLEPIRTYVPLPTITLESFWTPTLGISGDCAQGNHQFDYGGCWAGIVNNQFLLV